MSDKLNAPSNKGYLSTKNMDFLQLQNIMPGVGNFDDGEGHYIFTFTLEGHYAYAVKNI